MEKVIFYNIDLRLNRQDEHAVICETYIPYSEENLEYAKTHSVDGEYRVDYLPETKTLPSVSDVVDSILGVNRYE